MRASKLFGSTLRETPADADVTSAKLLLRAGYVRQLAAGVYSYLTLGQRSLRKIEAVLREEMQRIGGQEVTMPVVHPAEIWQQSGRWDSIDETMVRFTDRRGRAMLLAMTHEEVVAHLAASEIRSYKQLPQLIFQIQTKFRDEARPRGGIIRLREFVMKDSYSLDRDDGGLDQQYARHYDAYFRIAARVGVPIVAVKSDTGLMGGRMAHEFMYVTPIGEDSLVISETGYAANLEVAEFRKLPEENGPPAALSRVATPGVTTVEDLAAFLSQPKSRVAKTMFYVATYTDGRPPGVLAAVVRGDMEVNEVLLMRAVSVLQLRPAKVEEIVAVGAVPGYASPVGLSADEVTVIVDDLVERTTNLTVGANEEGHHYVNACCGRDYRASVVAHIVAAYDGAPSAADGSPMRLVRGVEVGNIFKLGTRYSASLSAEFLDEHGRACPIVMGSYGIGVGRLLACVAEEHHDERGLTLPITVAPFQVALVSLSEQGAAAQHAEALYRDLGARGIEVLFFDGAGRAGEKFADADLIGIPLRLTISDRSLKNGGVELKHRTGGDPIILPVDEVVERVATSIDELHRAVEAQVSEVLAKRRPLV